MLQVGVPCAAATARALQAFSPGEQKLIALSITGAFLSPFAASLWDPLRDPACPLCGQPCTKSHQLLECPVTASVREEFASTLAWVQQHASHWLHGSFGVEHPLEPFLRLVFSSRQMPDVPDIAAVVEQFSLSELCLYTDGSCSNPDHLPASHAGWAVVLDLNPNGPSSSLRGFWQRHRHTPGEFVVVARGLVPADQIIHRAEICAIVQALRIASRFPHLPVHIGTDSASALSAVTKVLRGPPCCEVFNRDLTCCLPTLSMSPSFRKIRAHCEPGEVQDGVLRATLGNWCADRAAESARLADFENIREDAEQVASWRRQQARHLHRYFLYLTRLAKVVVPLKKAERDTLVSAPIDRQLLASQWLALNDWGYLVVGLPVLPDSVILGMMWPPWYTTEVWEWASQLGWAAEPPRTDKLRGITYLELLVNFVVTRRQLPPKLIGVSGKGRYVDLLQDEGRLLTFTSQELLLSLVAVLKALTRGSRSMVMQAKSHHRIMTLTQFPGEGGGRKGLIDRPSLTMTQETWQLLDCFLQGNSAECFRHYCMASAPPKAADSDSRRRKALGRGV